jgi:arylsulfatase
MMEVFAGFGAHTDYEMGRVLDAVKAMPDADNTLIFYILGDNGSSAEGGLDGSENEIAGFQRPCSSRCNRCWGTSTNWAVQSITTIFPPAGPMRWTHRFSGPSKSHRTLAVHATQWSFRGPRRLRKRVASAISFITSSTSMPTILEAAGIQAPDTLNGVTQKPIEGVSMMYTFNDAKAPDRRKSQIFELVSNRGMYQNGWMASSMAYLPWAASRTGYDPDKAKWELYNIDQDFSQANDLAAQNPKKLKGTSGSLVGPGCASRHLAPDWRSVERLSEQITGRPNLAAGRKTFVYNGPLGSSAGRRSA